MEHCDLAAPSGWQASPIDGGGRAGLVWEDDPMALELLAQTLAKAPARPAASLRAARSTALSRAVLPSRIAP
jgi:hypothetical protein